MDQGQYISINKEVVGHSIYPSLTYHHGNYIFDGQIYSIWEFTKKENEEQTFLFSHPQNNLKVECAIYFTLPTTFSVFVNFFKCDIGKGIGRKMLEAFLNYLLDRSVGKYDKHKFTINTNICLIPGEIVDSNRLSNNITFDNDILIGYYKDLGFASKNDNASENANASELCGTVGHLLFFIKQEDNKRTGSSKNNYKRPRLYPFIKARDFTRSLPQGAITSSSLRKTTDTQRKGGLNRKMRKAQKTGYIPVTKSKSKPKPGGRKKQMTRKKRK